MGDSGWDVAGKVIDLLKLVIVAGLLVAVGVGLFNLDAVLAFGKQAIELLKAAR